jgi:hypothetical protein
MSRFQLWVAGWVDVACGLCAVATLGFWRPDWDMDFCCWCVRIKAHNVALSRPASAKEIDL